MFIATLSERAKALVKTLSERGNLFHRWWTQKSIVTGTIKDEFRDFNPLATNTKTNTKALGTARFGLDRISLNC